MKAIAKLQNRRIVDVHRWYKNGDHPLDNSFGEDGQEYEGNVVRYYRVPGMDGIYCKSCGKTMKEHGWIDSGALGNVVCPGSYIVCERGKFVAYNNYLTFTNCYTLLENEQPEDEDTDIAHLPETKSDDCVLCHRDKELNDERMHTGPCQTRDELLKQFVTVLEHVCKTPDRTADIEILKIVWKRVKDCKVLLTKDNSNG